VPLTTLAVDTNLIVCNTNFNTTKNKFDDPCTFGSLITLGINIMNIIILYSVPLAAIAFIVAGFLMVTAGGADDKIKRAKGIFTNTMIGFFFILAAWLIVKFIAVALLDQPFTLFG
jgi:hypothetical protein